MHAGLHLTGYAAVYRASASCLPCSHALSLAPCILSCVDPALIIAASPCILYRVCQQRLIQLNEHFAAQPPPTGEGSPFAAYFAVGGPDPVMKLGPLAGAAAAALGVGGGKGAVAGGKKGAAKASAGASGSAKAALRIPDGF